LVTLSQQYFLCFHSEPWRCCTDPHSTNANVHTDWETAFFAHTFFFFKTVINAFLTQLSRWLPLMSSLPHCIKCAFLLTIRFLSYLLIRVLLATLRPTHNSSFLWNAILTLFFVAFGTIEPQQKCRQLTLRKGIWSIE
jgi:hypothetical protein